VAHLLHGLKYRGQLAVARVLGTLLVEQVVAAELHLHLDILLPVPLHPVRHAGRGYNQSTELARWIARRLGCPLEPGLAARRRHTPPQVGLSLEQRRSNLAGAFAVSGLARGRHFTLVDDVTTTGSTLAELARALLTAGATGVDAWCVARAERGDSPVEPPAEPSPRVPSMR
jgi:ComF family protein